jgi:hypothetical protein
MDKLHANFQRFFQRSSVKLPTRLRLTTARVTTSLGLSSCAAAPPAPAGCRGLELDADDIIRADIISLIMCQGDVDITVIENRYGIDFWTHFSAARKQLAKLEAEGLVWICASRIVASSQGRYLLRVIAACFDRHLAAQA